MTTTNHSRRALPARSLLSLFALTLAACGTTGGGSSIQGTLDIAGQAGAGAPAYRVPEGSPTAQVRFQREESVSFNLANVHLDNANCGERRDFVGDAGSRQFHGKIAAGREITLSTWSDATWVGPKPFDIEFCNAIFTFTPEPGAEYLVARPVLERDCLVDVFRADGTPVHVEMRQPSTAGNRTGLWCENRNLGTEQKKNHAPKQLVDHLSTNPAATLYAL